MSMCQISSRLKSIPLCSDLCMCVGGLSMPCTPPSDPSHQNLHRARPSSHPTLPLNPGSGSLLKVGALETVI